MNRFLDEARSLPEFDSSTVEFTAKELSYYHYEPSLLIPQPGFAKMQKKELIEALEKLQYLSPDDLEAAGLPLSGEGASRAAAAAELKREQASLLLYHYRQLVGLRKNDSESWHIMDELYEDD